MMLSGNCCFKIPVRFTECLHLPVTLSSQVDGFNVKIVSGGRRPCLMTLF